MKNKNLISISGKKGSGKDTVGEIIQQLTGKTLTRYSSMLGKQVKLTTSPYSIKKWADALKQVCAIILGVPVSKFEDQEFKASELGEEWWTIYIYTKHYPYLQYKNQFQKDFVEKHLFKPTVRWLLQNIGTEIGRNIHPNMWVNILMNQYGDGLDSFYDKENDISGCVNLKQWIITDTRFENELQAIQDRNGLCVKVERACGIFMNKPRAEKINREGFEHSSETSLDHIKEWDWVFNNNGSIEDLVEQVKEFLTHFKII